MTINDFIGLEDQYSASNYAPAAAVIVRGKGVWVWDVDGKRYLDCVAGYSALNHGHGHPKILAALIDQANKLGLISRAFRTDVIGPFSEKLCEITSSKKTLLRNSGAEAVETALKTVRK